MTHSDLALVPAMLMRGGTSKGPFFRGKDLPRDPDERDRFLLAVMGSPHPLQIDGVGGGHPLTSKVGIVSVPVEPEIDLDFLFLQLQPESTAVQDTANCGNMLAGVVPFALEAGLLEPQGEETTAVVRTLDTGLVSRITVRTPRTAGRRSVAWSGDTRIPGVPGTGSPIRIRFLETAGSVADGLFPTENRLDVLELEDGRRVEATMIDNGQPMVLLRATDLGRTGTETPQELAQDHELKQTLEELRLKAGIAMGLGEVGPRNYPKMTLLSAPEEEGTAVMTRSFIPHAVHESIGVLAAVTVATAVVLPGTVAEGFTRPGTGPERVLGIGHPSGVFDVDLALDETGLPKASGITRTARLLMRGEIAVPREVLTPISTDAHEQELP